MSRFDLLLRDLLNPGGTAAGEKLIEFVENSELNGFDFKFEDLCREVRLAQDGQTTPLDGGDVVFGNASPTGFGCDVDIDAGERRLEEGGKEIVRGLGAHPKYLSFMADLLGPLVARPAL